MNTLTAIPSHKSGAAGFTLLEMMVALTIGVLVAIAATALFLYGIKTFTALGNYVVLDQKSRNALDVMSRAIRQAQSLTGYTPGRQLVFQGEDGSFSYTYNTNSGTVTYTSDGVSTVLLTNCNYWSFTLYQRNPATGYTFYPATQPTDVKLIDLNWRCERSLLAGLVNSESVQTAQIVIRN